MLLSCGLLQPRAVQDSCHNDTLTVMWLHRVVLEPNWALPHPFMEPTRRLASSRVSEKGFSGGKLSVAELGRPEFCHLAPELDTGGVEHLPLGTYSLSSHRPLYKAGKKYR